MVRLDFCAAYSAWKNGAERGIIGEVEEKMLCPKAIKEFNMTYLKPYSCFI